MIATRSSPRIRTVAGIATLVTLAACAQSTSTSTATPTPTASPAQTGNLSMSPPSPDPRIGLRAGRADAGEASWNLRVLSKTPAPAKFATALNSDLAFTGKYAIQGNFNGYQVWDISDPSKPVLATSYYCPASQSDVSTYKNLLFVSGESNSARLDCGAQGVREAVSHDRLRGIRIFDITDIHNPKYVANVQTCRGSHTHTVLVDPRDQENVYVYISGSSGVRPEAELAGCQNAGAGPTSALFRIEVIKVPLAHPERAAIVSSPRIFNDLVAPPSHGDAPEDKKVIEEAKARGMFIGVFGSEEFVLPDNFVKPMLDSIAKMNNRVAATRADSAALRTALPGILQKMFAGDGPPLPPNAGPTQCHDITVYPGIGYAGGACEGYGLLLDIRDPANPKRIGAVADSNFSYWHSATFNNDGTKVLFSDEWGGGSAPKCRATDPKEWGADAIFAIENGKMVFKGYYKLPAAQTAQENCVAHNGSLIPIPGRDVMVQAWYQGGISVFDWTDAAHPKEIAFFDRGPLDPTRMVMAGSWSVYWYNGVIVSSEIARGLDIFELTPSGLLSQNEIDAAKTVHLDYLNTQGQPKFVWPASFVLARAYLDQLERNNGVASSTVIALREGLASAEKATGATRRDALTRLATRLDNDARDAKDQAKVRVLASTVRDLAVAAR